MNNLLPCPFCGHTKAPSVMDDEEAQGTPNLFWNVRCDFNFGGCSAQAGYRPTVEAAVLLWNTRKPLAAVASPERDALAAKLFTALAVLELLEYDDDGAVILGGPRNKFEIKLFCFRNRMVNKSTCTPR